MIFDNYDRIVFAGDSVTDMGSEQPVGEGLFDNVGHGYVRVLESMFAAYYPEVFLRITNSGVSGNTSRDLLERFDRDVVELNPDWVSICIGINDVWRQFDTPAMLSDHILPDEYEKNVEEMILKIKGRVKGIFILSPYIIEPNADDFTIRHSSFIAWDRIHPNQVGATLMAKEFLKQCDFEYNHVQN